MKQTIFSNKERPLLAHAVSKLNPKIFSHPVWVQFSRKAHIPPPETIQALSREAEFLKRDQPGDACQVLLVCAAYQSLAVRNDLALRTTQQALALAERNSLPKEMVWATWGACAICFQESNFEQAARYLEYLQAGLSEQNEWILADFVEMVRQSLLQPGTALTNERPGLSQDRSVEDLLSITFDWLRQWGFWPPSAGPHYAFPEKRVAPASFRGRRSQGVWNTILHAIKGETKPEWIENDEQHTWQRSSLLHSVLGSIRSFLAGRAIEPRRTDDLHQLPGISNLPSVEGSAPKDDPDSAHATILPVVVQMLGPFSLTIQDKPLKLPASRGLSLLKYLLLHHKQVTPREILMDVFWPDADPEAARNSLNVAMHSLRQALRSATNVAVIRFEDGGYGLATNLDVWLDVEVFEQFTKEGQRLEVRNQLTAAVTKYEIAANLYQGDFLADSPYESWTVPSRERLSCAYLETLDRISQIYFSQERYAACIGQCQLLLAHDLCREDAHFRLMQCYSRLGQGPLALRQYQICTEALRAELDVNPAPETTRLYEHIRHREPV